MLNKNVLLVLNSYKFLPSLNKPDMVGSDFLKTNLEMHSEYLLYYKPIHISKSYINFIIISRMFELFY